MKSTLLFCFLSLITVISPLYSQNSSKLIPSDSLYSFDENNAIRIAELKGISPQEMAYYLEISHRVYIKSKYNLPINSGNEITNQNSKIVLTNCTNEDFEDGSLTSPIPGTITILNPSGINGWISNAGTLIGSITGSCYLSNCCNLNPNAVQVIAPGPSGLIDQAIGASYPIHSVFGNTLNTNATTTNGFNSYGDWFVKINNLSASVNRITKTFSVNSTNYIFDFAFVAVMQGQHCCCDNAGISVRFKDCSGNLLSSVQQFSLAPSQSSVNCTSLPIMSNCFVMSPQDSIGHDSIYPTTILPGASYTKWIKKSVNLSALIGTCVKIEVSAFRCSYNGHYGYMYFDSQCRPGIVSNVNILNIRNNIKLYPNPNSGEFNLEIQIPINNGLIEVKNILGQSMLNEKVNQGTNNISTKNLSKGIYAYEVIDDNEIIFAGKFIVD